MKSYEECLQMVSDVINYYKMKYSYLGYDAVQDIEQEAKMAVFHSMKLYDDTLGSFKSYATGWIKTYVFDYLNKVISVVSVSREVYRKIRLIKECFEQNPNATLDDVSKHTGLSKNQVYDYFRGISKVSLDAEVSKEEDTTFLELIPDNSDVDRQNRKLQFEAIEAIKSILSPKELDILFSFYGIGGRKLKQSEIAQKYNISHQAISKQIKQILEGLRVALSGQYGSAY